EGRAVMPLRVVSDLKGPLGGRWVILPALGESGDDLVVVLAIESNEITNTVETRSKQGIAACPTNHRITAHCQIGLPHDVRSAPFWAASLRCRSCRLVDSRRGPRSTRCEHGESRASAKRKEVPTIDNGCCHTHPPALCNIFPNSLQ